MLDITMLSRFLQRAYSYAILFGDIPYLKQISVIGRKGLKLGSRSETRDASDINFCMMLEST